MELNVYTIFNRIDGSSDQLILARSDARVSTDFVNSVNGQAKGTTTGATGVITLVVSSKTPTLRSS